MESKIDETDWRLLIELQQNARITFSELGRRVGMTPPAVAERVRRLEETGVIKGYRAEVDVRPLGYAISAVIRLHTGEGGCARFAAIAPEFPEIQECHRVTGGDSYVMKVTVATIQHLESLLDRLAVHGTTTTSIVLSSPVTHRVVEPPAPLPPLAVAGAWGGGDYTAAEVIPSGRRPTVTRLTT